MAPEPPASPRRLGPETIERYFKSPDTVVHLLSQVPRCELRVEPMTATLELRVPKDESTPNLNPFENIEVQYLADQDCYSLRFAASGMHYAAYSLIANIVEELQRGRNLSVAVSQSISEYEVLLQGRKLLSLEKQTGLMGELLLLTYLCSADPARALASWLGPESEQHDFAFEAFDLEVKATKSERRIHRIGSATQLEPSAGRPLWFLSVQVTSAGAAANAFCLADLVTQARNLLGPDAPRFDEYIEGLGWREVDEESYKNKYVLRSRPAFYPVDGNFPALRDAALRLAIPNYEHLSDVSYRTDVSHLQSVQVPEPLSGFAAYTSCYNGGTDAHS